MPPPTLKNYEFQMDFWPFLFFLLNIAALIHFTTVLGFLWEVLEERKNMLPGSFSFYVYKKCVITDKW